MLSSHLILLVDYKCSNASYLAILTRKSENLRKRTTSLEGTKGPSPMRPFFVYCICRTLGMSETVIVSQSPNKPNIFYSVQMKSAPLEEAFAPLVEELKRKRDTMDRVIIFAQSYEDCTSLFLFFRIDYRKNCLGHLDFSI